jgi:hypothetical protein
MSKTTSTLEDCEPLVAVFVRVYSQNPKQIPGSKAWFVVIVSMTVALPPGVRVT